MAIMMKWDGQEMPLLEFVAGMADECYIGRYDAALVQQKIENPEWKRWAWAKCVPDGFRENWDRLPIDVRLAIFAMACKAAMKA